MLGRQVGDAPLMNDGHGDIQYQQHLGAFVFHGGEGSAKIGIGTFHLEPLRLHACSYRCRVVGLLQGIPAVDTRDILVAQNRNTREVGDDLLKQFELFPRLLRVKAGDPRDTSTWPLKCRGKPDGDRIDRADEHDRNGWAGLPCRLSTNSPERDDDLHFETYQFGGEFRDSIQIPVSKATLDDDVPTLDIAELGKALAQRIEYRAWTVIRDYADARMLGRVLGR